MPAMPLAPQAIKVVYSGTYLTADWANIFYLKYAADTPVDADLATLATSIRGLWATHVASIHSTQVSLTQTSLVDIGHNPGAVGLNSTAAAGSGGVSALPANVAIAVSKKIARRYRGGHPRFYMCGIVATHTADGRSLAGSWASNYQTAWQAWLTAMNALSSTSTGALKVASVSYWRTPVRGEPAVLKIPPDVDLVSAMAVNARLDSQRRRLD